MYIQAIWNQRGNTGTIGQIVEIDSWESASLKLPDLYEGYTLITMNNPPFAVDKIDTSANCFICSYNSPSTGLPTTVYIFDKTLEGAAVQIKTLYGVEPTSVSETLITFKNEIL